MGRAERFGPFFVTAGNRLTLPPLFSRVCLRFLVPALDPMVRHVSTLTAYRH